MAKGRKKLAVWQGFLAGGLLSLGVYLLGLLAAALLLVNGVLPEGAQFTVVAALCALAALAGGVLTVRLTRWKAGGVLTALLFLSALLLAGLGFWEEITWLGHGGVLLLCGLAGGALSGAARPKTRRRH